MNQSQAPQAHQRVNASLLSVAEKRLLYWIAARLPMWVTPDILTGIGVFASFIIAISFYLTNFSPAYLWLASFGVILNWFGDSLDGTLARHRKIERPLYGFFLDHVVDSFDEMIVLIGLGFSPYVRFEVALLALVGYLLLSINVFLYTYVKGVFQISFLRLGPTEVRLIVILSNAAIFFLGNPVIQLPSGPINLYDIIMIFMAVLFLVVFIVLSIVRAVELSALDEERRLRRMEKRAKKERAKKQKQVSS